MCPFDLHFHISDPLILRNYKMVGKYLIELVDKGLDFLKVIYVQRNSDTSFQEFAADNYFDYILRDYLKRKIKNQLRFVLKGAIAANDFYIDSVIDQNQLDMLIDDMFPDYKESDLVLLHSDSHHEAYSEILLLSRLTLRVAIIQMVPIMNNPDPNADTAVKLILSSIPSVKSCTNSISALFSMFDQIIDVFERNLEIITIPFYRPTWRIRDFSYTRHLYEFALERATEEVKKVYNGANGNEKA